MATGTETARSVASTVAAQLDAAGITQLEAATKTGIPRSTLQRRLLGHSPFDIGELALIAGLLGTTIADLVATAEDAA